MPGEEKVTLKNAKDLDNMVRGFIVRSVSTNGPSIAIELESQEETAYTLTLSDQTTIGLNGDHVVLVKAIGISLTKVN